MTVNDYFEIDMLLGGVDAFFYFYFFDDLYYIEDIQQQLETFSINRAALFPEIECVAEYLRNKYTS